MTTVWVQVFESRSAFSSESEFHIAPTYLVEVKTGVIGDIRKRAMEVVKQCIAGTKRVQTSSGIWPSLETAVTDARKWGIPDHTLVALHIMDDGVRVPMAIIS